MSARKDMRKQLASSVESALAMVDDDDAEAVPARAKTFAAPITNQVANAGLAELESKGRELDEREAEMARREEDLKQQLADAEAFREAMGHARETGRFAEEIDPELIDDSPYRDRADWSFENANFVDLERSIIDNGQMMPVGLRPHPEEEGRYQIIFGHRRVRVCRRIGKPVKAVVRSVDDQTLVLLMEEENSQRADLSTYERARKYVRLLDLGVFKDMTSLCDAFKISKSLGSRHIKIGRLPQEIADALGSPYEVSYRQWRTLAEALDNPDRRERALEIAAEIKASDMSISQRLAALCRKPRDVAEIPIQAEHGPRVGVIKRESGRRLSVTLAGKVPDGLMERLADMLEAELRTMNDSQEAS